MIKATPKAKNAGQEAVQLDLFANYEDSQEVSLFSSYAGIENTDHLYQFIDNEKAQRILVQNLLGQKAVCFDTETTSLNEFEAGTYRDEFFLPKRFGVLCSHSRK